MPEAGPPAADGAVGVARVHDGAVLHEVVLDVHVDDIALVARLLDHHVVHLPLRADRQRSDHHVSAITLV